MKKIIMMVLCAACILSGRKAWADMPGQEVQIQVLQQQVKQLAGTVQELKLMVEAQQRELISLKAQPAPPQGMEQAASVPSGSLQGRWNPDIGVVADTVLKLDGMREDAEGSDRLSVRELELVFGSAIDPYSRLDATVAFSDFEEPHLEEAYVTRFGLPWDVTGRLGRFKPRVGKAIPLHLDSLDTVDEPLVIQRYFGRHGYSKSGADLLKGFDSPFAFHEISFGVLEGGNGEDGTLFGATRRRPTVVSHLKNYRDLSDVDGLEIGLSHLAGSRDADTSMEVNVIGLDGTWIHRLGDRRHVKLQTEAFHVNRRESFVDVVVEATSSIFANDVDEAKGLWGGYLLADYRFDPQWAAGLRYDDVQLIMDPVGNLRNKDQGYTGYLTFHQSEFARWRAQFTHLKLADGRDDNQVMLQGTFAIGEHKHKLQ